MNPRVLIILFALAAACIIAGLQTDKYKDEEKQRKDQEHEVVSRCTGVPGFRQFQTADGSFEIVEDDKCG
jgi:hypothetical protein